MDFQPPHKLSHSIHHSCWFPAFTLPCNVLSHHHPNIHILQKSLPAPLNQLYNPSLGDPFFDISGTLEDIVHDGAPIHDTSRPVRGNDCCKLQYHLLSESESKALVPSFGFQLLDSIHGHQSVHCSDRIKH
ncbi:hypothetical protein Tco_0876191 [Tanacetum coccineum]|uniref:Uncharacterized protein n=1 Tax=Tanacetum coccineum TaxID=301880 RepID=A0ABQ5BRK8_9ASTR